MYTGSKSLHSVSRLPIIVEMINGLRIGANEGGQRPSEMVYLADRETPCAPVPLSAKISRKYLAKLAGIATSLPGSGKNVESDVSYRKQRADFFLPGTRTAQCRPGFLVSGARFLACILAGASNPAVTPKQPAAAPRGTAKYRELPEKSIQNLCGTIVFSAIVRPHGISSAV